MLRVMLALALAATIDPPSRLHLQWPVPVLARELHSDVDQAALWQPTLKAPGASTSATATRTTSAQSVDAVPTSTSETWPTPTNGDSPADGASSTYATGLSTGDTAAELEIAAPRRTYMKCLGTTTSTRACHLQDVYYDLRSGHFLYYGPAGAAPGQFGRGEEHPRGDPWLRLIRYAPAVASTAVY